MPHPRAICTILLLLSSLASAQTGRATVTAKLNVSALHPGDHAIAAVIVDIAPGLHAQSHHPTEKRYIPLDIKPSPTPDLTYADPTYPPGLDQSSPALGPINVYEGQVFIYLPLQVSPDAKPGPLTVAGTITYQICNESSCFLPQRNKPWSVTLPIVPAGTQVQPANPERFAPFHPQATQPTTAPTTRPIEIAPTTQTPPADDTFHSATAAFAAAFLAGLLFNVMPCVLPVLPLKAIGFYEVSQHNRAKSLSFGLAFSLGLVAVFALLALLILVLRVVSWGSLFSHGWFVWTIVAILFAMGLGLMDLFTLPLPTAVYNITPRHDTYVGNFLFGGLTAILATPCTAPLLPPLLLWASTRPGYVGVPAVVMVGVGMASPYMILSAFPEVARRFPRAGAGAELFKQMMAWMLLVAATYFAAGRLIEGPSFWWAVTAAVAVAALFLVGRTVQISDKAGALACSSLLAVSMVGGTAWWSARLTGLGSHTTVDSTWQPFSRDAFTLARQSGKPVLVKFTANWCGTCQTIEGTVFTDPAVWAQLHQLNVITFKADFSNDNPEAQDLLLTLNPSGGIPLTALYLPAHDRPVTLASVYTSSTLLDILAKITPSLPRNPS